MKKRKEKQPIKTLRKGISKEEFLKIRVERSREVYEKEKQTWSQIN
jgi:hypothetical protein